MLKFVATANNAFTWDSSSFKVNTPVVALNIARCSSKLSRKKRSVPTVPFLTGVFSVSIDLGQSDDGQLVNETANTPFGMIHHSYNLSFPGTASILIVVNPVGNGSMNVYISTRHKSSPMNFVWFLSAYGDQVTTTPIQNGSEIDNQTNSQNGSASATNMLLIPPTNLAGVAQVFVGVQSSEGRSVINSKLRGRRRTHRW